jgi:hypothetical protein
MEDWSFPQEMVEEKWIVGKGSKFFELTRKKGLNFGINEVCWDLTEGNKIK